MVPQFRSTIIFRFNQPEKGARGLRLIDWSMRKTGECIASTHDNASPTFYSSKMPRLLKFFTRKAFLISSVPHPIAKIWSFRLGFSFYILCIAHDYAAISNTSLNQTIIPNTSPNSTLIPSMSPKYAPMPNTPPYSTLIPNTSPKYAPIPSTSLRFYSNLQYLT